MHVVDPHGGKEESRAMEREGEDRLDSPSEGPLHQGRRDDRAYHGATIRQPKGPGSGVRMIQFFINRAGRSLSATRRRELERAKRLLQASSISHGRKTAAKHQTRTTTGRRRRL